jgi:catechol 2,3-dioxygenase-like lactoylglutathione lyase family enzyme
MSLQHVSVELPEAGVPAELEFWRLLGFERVEPPPPINEIAVWVQREGTQIHFLFTDEPVVPQGGHVAVVAEDWQAAFDRLRDAGFTPDEHRRPWGAARAFVRTPGGHLVEFMEYPPVR